MAKVIVAIMCMALYTLTMAANAITKDLGSTTMKYQEARSNENYNLDMERIMNECNETFRIEMTYLESLNETGSFSDEADKTPKCFIRCMLENMDIMSSEDGMFNPARAAILFAGDRNGKPMEDIGDLTAICADRREPCKCERAYQFMRCLMSMEIEKYESKK
ncbi:unnamed protein product [Arctia plantaginis]|uniref:Uncharacterized protein n=1 Tax=Arctia plantaginis TaxID=874455 RepID=A0A8S1BF08_ARCPL|nr:unnamed protein product [Arctia plantaginis]